VGAGPIGLATIMTAKLFTPAHIVAIDLDDGRLEKALEFGADSTITTAIVRPEVTSRTWASTGIR
jgi:alcohol dehydrogenase